MVNGEGILPKEQREFVKIAVDDTAQI